MMQTENQLERKPARKAAPPGAQWTSQSHTPSAQEGALSPRLKLKSFTSKPLDSMRLRRGYGGVRGRLGDPALSPFRPKKRRTSWRKTCFAFDNPPARRNIVLSLCCAVCEMRPRIPSWV